MALDQETPNDPDILNLIGFSLRKTGPSRPVRSTMAYNRALAQKPDHLGANEYLGEPLPGIEAAGESRRASRRAAERLRRLRGVSRS